MMLGYWLNKKNPKQDSDEAASSEEAAKPESVAISPEAISALMKFRDSTCERYALGQFGVDAAANRVSATNARILLSVEMNSDSEPSRKTLIPIQKYDSENIGKFPKVDAIHEINSSCHRRFDIDLELLKTVVDALLEITIFGTDERQLVTVFIPEADTDPIHFHSVMEDGSAKAALMPLGRKCPSQ